MTPGRDRNGSRRALALAATLGLFLAGCDSGQIAAPVNYGVNWTRITNATDAFDPYFPEWRGDQIVFSYRVGSYRRLATMKQDGSNLTYLSAGSTERVSPAHWVDDSTVVYALKGDATFDLWMRVLTTDQIQKLTTFPGDEFDPSPRPGTTTLAYTDGSEFQGRVTLIPDYRSGSPEQIFLTPPTMKCGQVDWDPAGQRICFTADSSGFRHIWMITLTPGDSTAVKVSAGPYVDSAPHFSPDGTRLLFASDNRTGRPGVWTIAPSGDPASLKAVAFDDIGSVLDTPCWSPDGSKVAVSSNGRGFGRAIWVLSNLP